jgi:hypothetical protein
VVIFVDNGQNKYSIHVMKIPETLIKEANKLAKRAGYIKAHSIVFSERVKTPQIIKCHTPNFDYSNNMRSINYSFNKCIVVLPKTEISI